MSKKTLEAEEVSDSNLAIQEEFLGVLKIKTSIKTFKSQLNLKPSWGIGIKAPLDLETI